MPAPLGRGNLLRMRSRLARFSIEPNTFLREEGERLFLHCEFLSFSFLYHDQSVVTTISLTLYRAGTHFFVGHFILKRQVVSSCLTSLFNCLYILSLGKFYMMCLLSTIFHSHVYYRLFEAVYH